MVYGTLSAFHLWNLWTQSQRHPQSSSFPANKNTRRLMMQRDGDYLRLDIIVYFKIQHDEYFIACYLRIMLDFFYGNQFFYITFAFDLCSKKVNYFSLIFFLCYFLYSVLYVRGCQVIHIEILIFPRASFCVSQNGNMYLELSVA